MIIASFSVQAVHFLQKLFKKGGKRDCNFFIIQSSLRSVERIEWNEISYQNDPLLSAHAVNHFLEIELIVI